MILNSLNLMVTTCIDGHSTEKFPYHHLQVYGFPTAVKEEMTQRMTQRLLKLKNMDPAAAAEMAETSVRHKTSKNSIAQKLNEDANPFVYSESGRIVKDPTQPKENVINAPVLEGTADRLAAPTAPGQGRKPSLQGSPARPCNRRTSVSGSPAGSVPSEKGSREGSPQGIIQSDAGSSRKASPVEVVESEEGSPVDAGSPQSPTDKATVEFMKGITSADSKKPVTRQVCSA